MIATFRLHYNRIKCSANFLASFVRLQVLQQMVRMNTLPIHLIFKEHLFFVLGINRHHTVKHCAAKDPLICVICSKEFTNRMQECRHKKFCTSKIIIYLKHIKQFFNIDMIQYVFESLVDMNFNVLLQYSLNFLYGTYQLASVFMLNGFYQQKKFIRRVVLNFTEIDSRTLANSKNDYRFVSYNL